MVVPLKRTDDPDDMNQLLLSEDAHEKQFHTYEYAIDKNFQRGSSISLRMQVQANNSIVESFAFIYRAKPIR